MLGNWADIYVVPASGGVPRNLTQSSTADEEEPSWSPDGTKIVYGRYGEDAGDSPDIWVMNSDGSDQRALIGTPDYDHSPHGRRPDKKSPSCGSIRPLRGSQITTWKSSSSGPTEPAFVANRSPYYDSEPAWSPDGTRIVFVSNRTGSDELFVLNAEGGGLKQLTEHEQPEGLLALGEYAGPAWGRSPRR